MYINQINHGLTLKVEGNKWNHPENSSQDESYIWHISWLYVYSLYIFFMLYRLVQSTRSLQNRMKSMMI
jgi:hypothetical protein